MCGGGAWLLAGVLLLLLLLTRGGAVRGENSPSTHTTQPHRNWAFLPRSTLCRIPSRNSMSVLQAQCKGEKPGKAEDFHRLWTGGREKGDKGRQKGGKEEKKEARKRTYFMKTFFIHSWNTCNRQ
uniref:Uncharacterized protein n=1 Tax=Serinus canaria TaxID=9135 RepID=A0A8C9N1X0_SERCA